MKTKLKKIFSWILILAFCNTFVFPFPAMAKIITTESALNNESHRASDITRIKNFLQRQEIQDQLRAYDVDPEEAVLRVDSLSDQEVSTIINQLDQMPAGGTDGVSLLISLMLLGAIVVVVGIVIFFKWLLFDDESHVVSLDYDETEKYPEESWSPGS